MNRSIIALLSLLSLTGCGPAPTQDGTQDPIRGARGDLAAAAGFEAVAAVVQQTNQAIEKAAGTGPGASIPNVAPQVLATGFVGPLTGPDGTDGWYKQTYTNSGTRKTTGKSVYELFLKAEPPADLASAWPAKIKELSYAWIGTKGAHAGYQWSSRWTVYSARHVKGDWTIKVEASPDPDSYARYWVGSHHAGDFDLAGAAPGDSTMATVHADNRMNAVLHIESGYHHFITGAVPVKRRRSDWYSAWSWTLDFNQIRHYAFGVTSISGPYQYTYVSYWGKGTDPKLTGLPAYSESANPPAAIWADADLESGKGLYSYAAGEARAGADYRKTFGLGFTEPVYAGSCLARGTSLSYQGGPACVIESTDCKDAIPALFAHCPR